ncbi:CLC_0170 family protein [Paenibacillus sp. DMB20]|uniref:CLC_0170 family protein n=1 Tax=Paenibacillus sp. DMB20 TaxID=1642570 RepID=UPI000627A3BD|nr:CLC_0170 family protein [Paenibacillus sp. DMB20]KKO53365.1 hypothetical protein XI25_13740 [Paenibacillus sp. DMB20]
MDHTAYAWYLVGILIVSGVILFVLDAKFARSENRQKERAIVRSFGWVHLGLSIIGLGVLLFYLLLL